MADGKRAYRSGINFKGGMYQRGGGLIGDLWLKIYRVYMYIITKELRKYIYCNNFSLFNSQSGIYQVYKFLPMIILLHNMYYKPKA